MRISCSAVYKFHAEMGCDLGGCRRNYCHEHRLLYWDCEAATETHDGIGRSWFELGECPSCVETARTRRWMTHAYQH